MQRWRSLKGVLCAVCLGGLLATLGGHVGCASLAAVDPACASDAGACTEAWCADIAEGCEKKMRLCGEPTGECNQAVCTRSYGGHARAFAKPDEQVSGFKACVGYATTCQAVEDCFPSLLPEKVCPDVGRTDAGPLLESHIGVSSATGAGVVVLPGDSLDCLHCALQKGGCAELTPDCFQAAPGEAGATDTCLDYRTCLRMCQEGTVNDARRYFLCAKTSCDTQAHALGKADFERYQRCMLRTCSACFAGSSP